MSDDDDNFYNLNLDKISEGKDSYVKWMLETRTDTFGKIFQSLTDVEVPSIDPAETYDFVAPIADFLKNGDLYPSFVYQLDYPYDSILFKDRLIKAIAFTRFVIYMKEELTSGLVFIDETIEDAVMRQAMAMANDIMEIMKDKIWYSEWGQSWNMNDIYTLIAKAEIGLISENKVRTLWRITYGEISD